MYFFSLTPQKKHTNILQFGHVQLAPVILFPHSAHGLPKASLDISASSQVLKKVELDDLTPGRCSLKCFLFNRQHAGITRGWAK
jgi:hypothetical protein